MNTTMQNSEKGALAVPVPVDLRDHFAALAMQSRLSAVPPGRIRPGETELVAWDAYRVADAMLAERAKPT